MTPEEAKQVIKLLVAEGEAERLVYQITDMLLYRSDPDFWNDWIDSLPDQPHLAGIQAETDQMLKELKDALEKGKE